jgi:hypothetical protein
LALPIAAVAPERRRPAGGEDHMCRYAILGLVAALAVYALSIGPVFCYYARSNYDVSLPRMPTALYDVYRPLFRFLPETTSWYLTIWGVSEIDAFFISDFPQNVIELEPGRGNSE